MPQSPPRLAAVLLVLVAFAAPAFAQDDPRFALVASFPTPTVSFQWELTDRFAIRFDGSYAHRDESIDYVSGQLGLGSIVRQSTTTTDTSTSSGSFGVVGIVTIHRTDRMRLYLAPRVFVSATRQHVSETESPSTSTLPSGTNSNVIVIFGPNQPTTTEAHTAATSPGAGLSFGASSNVFSRVALFGEAGFSYSRSNGPLSSLGTLSLGGLSETRHRTTSVSTRAVAGVMFLF